MPTTSVLCPHLILLIFQSPPATDAPEPSPSTLPHICGFELVDRRSPKFTVLAGSDIRPFQGNNHPVGRDTSGGIRTKHSRSHRSRVGTSGQRSTPGLRARFRESTSTRRQAGDRPVDSRNQYPRPNPPLVSSAPPGIMTAVNHHFTQRTVREPFPTPVHAPRHTKGTPNENHRCPRL
jgi:hypothetical protein